MNNIQYFGLLSMIFVATSLIASNDFNSGRAYIVGFVFAVITLTFYIIRIFKINTQVLRYNKENPTHTNKSNSRNLSAL